MARKKLIRSDHLPYHVTARVNNRERFPIPLEDVWNILLERCAEIILLYGVEVHALVLMPNHFHLLITVPFEDLGVVSQHFMRSVTEAIHSKSGRCGRVFGASYHRVLVHSGGYYNNVLKYVYRNPVKGGIVSHVEDYPFSTLRGLLGKSYLLIPLSVPRCGFGLNLPGDCAADLLDWLNRPFPKEVDEVITRGLRRKKFTPPAIRSSRRKVDFEKLL